MSTTISSADLDPRRRKALFRAWRRGMKEMDIVMGGFADAHLSTLSDAELADFEALMDAPDPDVLGWLTGALALPDAYDTELWRRLKAFHTHSAPIHR